MKKQVFLIGYRATGKTTVAKKVSEIIGWDFVDVDAEIERLTSRKITDIFKNDGEDKFREIESEVLKTLSKLDKTVFSTGGGIILLEKNREIIKEGFVVLLEASIQTIMKRMMEDNSRPPLTNLTLEEEIQKTLSQRQPIYNQMYHLKIVNENVSPETIANLIANIIPFKQ